MTNENITLQKEELVTDVNKVGNDYYNMGKLVMSENKSFIKLQDEFNKAGMNEVEINDALAFTFLYQNGTIALMRYMTTAPQIHMLTEEEHKETIAYVIDKLPKINKDLAMELFHYALDVNKHIRESKAA